MQPYGWVYNPNFIEFLLKDTKVDHKIIEFLIILCDPSRL